MHNNNLTSRIDAIEHADVVVIGSGIAGICAAIAAARLGCDVILLENDAVLGGNSSPNLGIHISGAHSFHPSAMDRWRKKQALYSELAEKRKANLTNAMRRM